MVGLGSVAKLCMLLLHVIGALRRKMQHHFYAVALKKSIPQNQKVMWAMKELHLLTTISLDIVSADETGVRGVTDPGTHSYSGP